MATKPFVSIRNCAKPHNSLGLVPDRLGQLGYVLARINRVPEVIAFHERALCVDSDYAPAHIDFRVVLAGLGRPDEAVRYCEEALTLRPDFTATSNALARLREDP
jgi:tetratricopeptide (TPR) repeat protein